jgi:hypothetical protein
VVLNVLNELLLLNSVESNACSRATSSSSSSRSVNVGLSVLWRLNLHNEINTRNIKSTGSNISSNQYTELFILKSLQSDFTLILSNVSMHDLNVFLDLF